MQKMYSLRQNTTGMTKAEALRLAQDQLATGAVGPGGENILSTRGTKLPQLKDAGVKDWTHPYYWAPFILIGNWK
jgi:CHAT domain-containing protein